MRAKPPLLRESRKNSPVYPRNQPRQDRTNREVSSLHFPLPIIHDVRTMCRKGWRWEDMAEEGHFYLVG